MKVLLWRTLNRMFPNCVYLQGAFDPFAAYPDTFVTFFTDSTDDNSFYDNNVNTVDWYFSVILYSTNPTVMDTQPAEIISALKAKGFIPQGKGRDIPSDVPTHTGWAMDFIITEHITNES